MLTSTLNDDGEPVAGVIHCKKATRTQPFDYIMHGLVYRVDEQERTNRLQVSKFENFWFKIFFF